MRLADFADGMATTATLNPTMTQDDMNKMLVKMLSAAFGIKSRIPHGIPTPLSNCHMAQA